MCIEIIVNPKNVKILSLEANDLVQGSYICKMPSLTPSITRPLSTFRCGP